MEQERFAKLQALYLDEMFALTDGDDAARRKFEQLALDTYDALESHGAACLPLGPFSIEPDSAYNPNSNKPMMDRLPPRLASAWVEWKKDYRILVDRNPKIALYDMLSWVSETHVCSSWPAGWERSIRDWVDAGSLTPTPFDDRWNIITPEFYARLRQARAQCRGWLFWDGIQVKFVPDGAKPKPSNEPA